MVLGAFLSAVRNEKVKFPLTAKDIKDIRGMIKR
jgi:hypothetical protein